jgi:hypothetical protein
LIGTTSRLRAAAETAPRSRASEANADIPEVNADIPEVVASAPP